MRCLPDLLPFLVAAAFGAAACDEPEPSPAQAPAGGATSAAAPADPLARAQAAAKRLGGAVRTRLVDAMNHGGAVNAVSVCASEAQAIAAGVRQETGVTVGRSSLRLRNEADAPPPWVGDWLRAQGERKAEGVVGMSAVVDTPQGKMARVIVPIAIEATCMPCHGHPSAIAPEVKAVLEAKYPTDKATGYAIGDLRGALWAEAPAGG